LSVVPILVWPTTSDFCAASRNLVMLLDICFVCRPGLSLQHERRPSSKPGAGNSLATAVADAKYCFQGQGAGYPEHEGLRLLCAGREHCLPGFHVARTDFACVLVEFVVEGRGKLRADGAVADLFPGVIFSYRMNTPHDIWAEPADPMTKYFAAYQVSGQHDVAAQLGIAPGSIRWTRDIAAVQTLFEELIREGQLSGDLHLQITARYLELILLKAGEAVPPTPGQGPSGAEAFQRALACIESEFAHLATLDDLGQRVGLEANYLCRLFRRFGQETPNQCITRHKVNRAAELLLTQSHSVGDIARQVGYDDPYYFSRVFKKRFGYSPREFRSVARQNRIW
jgi:AraC-like DNA-binding protein